MYDWQFVSLISGLGKSGTPPLPLKDIKEQCCTQVEGENNCNGYTKEVPPFNIILLEDQKLSSQFSRRITLKQEHTIHVNNWWWRQHVLQISWQYTKFMARYECGGNHYLCAFVMCCPLWNQKFVFVLLVCDTFTCLLK